MIRYIQLASDIVFYDISTQQATWVSDFASVFDKMLFNGYDVNTLDVAEYACCTRSPPSRDSKKMWSTFQCDPEAICSN